MAHHKGGREVVYVERGGDSSAKWLFWGAVLGAGLALMYAPRTGEETSRVLQRKLWKLRAVDEEDELDEADALPPLRPRSSGPSAREELERRLAESRARRRAVGDYEEP